MMPDTELPTSTAPVVPVLSETTDWAAYPPFVVPSVRWDHVAMADSGYNRINASGTQVVDGSPNYTAEPPDRIRAVWTPVNAHVSTVVYNGKDTGMDKFVRTDAAGINVLNFDYLDIAARVNFRQMLDRWAGEIEVDLSETEATDAERAEAIDGTVNVAVDNALGNLEDDPEIDLDTERLIKDHLLQRLLERYGLEV